MVGFNGKNYVFVANTVHSFEMKEVRNGIRFDGHIEITSGIKPDMQLLNKGSGQFNFSKKGMIVAILL